MCLLQLLRNTLQFNNLTISLISIDQTVTIIVNGVKFETQVSPLEDVKGFRYVSFALATDLDVQEFFYDCKVQPNLPTVNEQPEKILVE